MEKLKYFARTFSSHNSHFREIKIQYKGILFFYNRQLLVLGISVFFVFLTFVSKKEYLMA